MGFVPITVDDYVRSHRKSNPGSNEHDLRERLRQTLAAYHAGARCSNCSERIWVIGSAEVGHMCFTCITGEAYPEDDYEIAEACDKGSATRSRGSLRRA